MVLREPAGTVTFKYDPFGRRVYKQSPNATSVFAYDGDNLVETVNGSGGEVASYAQGQNIDQPLAMERGSTVDYYEADGLGTITSLTAANGTVAQSYTYDSFGNQTASSGSLTNFFRYAGREFDAETNLYFNRARYLDPATGRFLGEDPLGFDGDGPNFYPYVENDPTTSVDPFGLQHQPGGPYHPPMGTPIRCNELTDDCPVLIDKIEQWVHQIASHYLWDWTRGTTRHQDPVNGSPGDVNEMWNGLNRCLRIFYKKCVDCQGPPPSLPIPLPLPSEPVGGPVYNPLPEPGGPASEPEPVEPPELPIEFPDPIPVW